jgi:hypothetical protein
MTMGILYWILMLLWLLSGLWLYWPAQPAQPRPPYLAPANTLLLFILFLLLGWKVFSAPIQ